MKPTRDIIFIRHGKTADNLERRYIGRTDEPLCEEGIAELRGRRYPPADIVIGSPLRRCLQTARIIYPSSEPLIVPNLRECDFGDFEGKNYLELSDNPDYIRWIESNGTLPFPNGESHEAFTRRCVEAFAAAVRENTFATAAFVVHGGTMMAILEHYALPKRAFYDYQVKNGDGFLTSFDGAHLTVKRELTFSQTSLIS